MIIKFYNLLYLNIYICVYIYLFPKYNNYFQLKLISFQLLLFFLGMHGGTISVSCSGWSAADLTSSQVSVKSNWRYNSLLHPPNCFFFLCFTHMFLGMYWGRISVSCSGWSAADLTSNQVLWSSYKHTHTHTHTQNSGYLK